MISRCLFHLLFASLLLPSCAKAGELFPFVLPWDDASINVTNLSGWNHKPAGKYGFVRAENGHLYAGSERIRFLGVNIVFGSVAPGHAEADKIAARLARFGVNIVRFHHMDSRPAPDGLLQKDLKTLDPAMLERFDYFVAALKKEGIYSNINLHVGRKYPGFKDWGAETPNYWKGVDNFFPPMIVQQKEYARDLLNHRNPYTGKRYVEEPAVALVEINNENGLLREWRTGAFDEMTEPYRGELARQWNAWLAARYADTATLTAAWGVRHEPPGKEMLGSKLNVRSNEAGWNLQLVGSAQAQLNRDAEGAVRLELTRTGVESWHTQLHQNGLVFAADRPYTLSLRLRADQPLKLGVTAMQAHAPWQRLWSQELKVGKDWQTWQFTFAPSQSDEVARLTLTGLGQSIGHLWLADASLKPGGLLGLAANEKLENASVQIAGSGEFQNRTVAGQRDWLRFLWDTESAYWLEMQRYLKNDLAVQAPVIGTQVSYSPASIQSGMDVVDGHAYWQHPRFPGKPWDRDNWNIGNSPMAGEPGGGTLADLARRRVAGKPYVVTEYNHSAPSLYQGEALPLATAYAALQDWDGLFVYSYGAHSKDWNPGYINNFFDSHANPVKMTSLIASAALLRRGDVHSSGLSAQILPDTLRWIDGLRSNTRMPSADIPGAAVLMNPVGLGSVSTVEPVQPIKSSSGELVWDKTTTIDTPLSKGVIGQKAGRVMLSGVGFELREARNDWGVLLATVVEGQGFSGPAKILFTALGQVENTGQQWLDQKKTTIGRHWGQAPSLLEGLGARLTLPVAASRVKAWALDERGNRREALVIGGGKDAVVEIGERYKTLWYEVEIR